MFTSTTRYLNFSPTDGFRLYADGMVTRLLELAPHDSSAVSSIEKADGKYSCRIVVVTAIHRFEAFVESVAAKSALEEARRRVLRQLSKWRRKRFAGMAATIL